VRKIQNKSAFIFIFDKKTSRPFLKLAPLTQSTRARADGPSRRSNNRPASSVVDKTQAGPLMVPAYLNVRATGGAVKSLAKDWREI